jgi:quercetin dioxygenase-like cupin family protein
MAWTSGDIIDNPVTGEHVIVLVGAEDTGAMGMYDLRLAPGGAVTGEHVHPGMEEAFTVISSEVGFRITGQEGVAPVGERFVVPAGTRHDWWNAGRTTARVLVEVRPSVRFEKMRNELFTLARNGETDSNRLPVHTAKPVLLLLPPIGLNPQTTRDLVGVRMTPLSSAENRAVSAKH